MVQVLRTSLCLPHMNYFFPHKFILGPKNLRAGHGGRIRWVFQCVSYFFTHLMLCGIVSTMDLPFCLIPCAISSSNLLSQLIVGTNITQL